MGKARKEKEKVKYPQGHMQQAALDHLHFSN